VLVVRKHEVIKQIKYDLKSVNTSVQLNRLTDRRTHTQNSIVFIELPFSD